MYTKYLILIPTFLIFYNFCANLSNDIYLPCMPRLVQLLDTTPHMMQLTMTAWFVGVAAPQLFFGPLSDRIGRKPILIGGGICFILATLLCSLATNITTLWIGRFFQGVGVCTLNVTTFAILIDYYDYKRRADIMNKICIFGTLAPLVGPILGGLIFNYIGWRSNFVLILIMAMISVGGLWFALPETNLTLNPYSLRWKSLYENYSSLLKNKYFLNHVMAYCLLLGGLVAYLTAAPFIIINKLNIPTLYFGYTQLPIFLLYIGGAVFLNQHLDETKLPKFLFTGFVLTCIGAGLMTILNFSIEQNIWTLILPMVLYVLGLSLCASPLIAEGMSTISEHKGSASAFLGFCMAMSCALATFLLQLFYDGSTASLGLFLLGLTLMATMIYGNTPPKHAIATSP